MGKSYTAICAVMLLSAMACADSKITQTEEDSAFAWRLSSGAKGERGVAALPLYAAAVKGDLSQLSTLIEGDTSPNLLLAPGGWSVLEVAIYRNDKPMIEYLLKHGADINYVSEVRTSETPLATALSFGVFRKDLTIFRYLVEQGADVNKAYGNLDIAVYAAIIGRMDMVNYLLDHEYRRDLTRLNEALDIRMVSDDMQEEKDKALSKIKVLLKGK